MKQRRKDTFMKTQSSICHCWEKNLSSMHLYLKGSGCGGCDLADNRQNSRRKCKVIYTCIQGLLAEYPEGMVYIPI